MASLTYTAQDEYGNNVIVRLPDWTGQPLLATTATPPDGTLVADGSEVSRASYPELFAKIGTTYGAGDGVTTFALPDWRDEFPRFSGADRAVGTKQGDAIRNIVGALRNFLVQSADAAGNAYGVFRQDKTETDGLLTATSTVTVSQTGDLWDFNTSFVVPTADENRPRNIAFLPCIIYV